MIRELEALQWITLGSIGVLVVLVVLCGLMLLVVWLMMQMGSFTTTAQRHDGGEGNRDHEAQPVVSSCRRGSHSGTPHALAIDDTVEYAALFRNELEPGQLAEVTEDLCWVMGSGFRLPVGSRVQLIRRYGTTTGGERWTGMHEGHFCSSIPAGSLKPVAAVTRGKCE